MDLMTVLLSTTPWANAGGAIGAGLAAVGAGIGIGIYYGWKLALLVIAICPLFAFFLGMRIKYKEEGASKDAELFEEAGKVH